LGAGGMVQTTKILQIATILVVLKGNGVLSEGKAGFAKGNRALGDGSSAG
jgi:hypothetical protein